MDSAECADLFSFKDQITNWDNFQPEEKLKTQFLKVLENEILPACIYIREQPPLPRCQKDDKENISSVK